MPRMLRQLRPWTKRQTALEDGSLVTFVEGEFIDTVIGIAESRTEIVMLRPPDGGAGVELASFVRPDHEPGSSSRASSGPTTSPDRPPRWPPSWSAQHLFRDRRPPGGRRRTGCERIRTDRRDRSAREHLADGPCARAGGNRRLADRADRLTPSGCPLPKRHLRRLKALHGRVSRGSYQGIRGGRSQPVVRHMWTTHTASGAVRRLG